MNEMNWCSEVTDGKLRIEVFEYQDRRKVPYSIKSVVTSTCSNDPGKSFGLQQKVLFDENYVKGK